MSYGSIEESTVRFHIENAASYKRKLIAKVMNIAYITFYEVFN